MKKMKKALCLTLTVILSSTMLFACGSKKDSSTEKSATPASTSAATAASTSSTDGKKYTVGIAQIAPHPSLDNCRNGFIAGLKEEGFVEGKNVTFDYQNASGETSNAAMITNAFVSKNYDLICGVATPTAMAAYNSAVNTKIPVIFCAVSDPVAAELVDSMDKPGHNCTGTSDALPLEEQMKMIRAFMPNAKTIGILYTTSEVNSATHLKKFKELAPKYGFKIEAIGVTNASDIPIAMDNLVTKVDCINNFTDNNVVNNLDTVLSKANDAGIPVFGSEEEQVKKGCVASQSIDYFSLGKQTGQMAAKVLKGEDASTMPVSVISDCKPVANKEAMAKFKLTMPKDYADTVTYLTADKK